LWQLVGRTGSGSWAKIGFEIKGTETSGSAIRHLVNDSKFLNLGNELYYVRARTGKETSSFSPTIVRILPLPCFSFFQWSSSWKYEDISSWNTQTTHMNGYKGYESVTEVSVYPSLLEWHRRHYFEWYLHNDYDSMETINSIMQYTVFQN